MTSNVRTLHTERTYVISPKVLYKTGETLYSTNSNGGSRPNLLRRLHGMLEFERDLPFAGGVIQIGRFDMKIVTNDTYWGGDGIVIGIPASYTADQLREALIEKFFFGNELVIFDPATRTYHGLDRADLPKGQPTTQQSRQPE